MKSNLPFLKCLLCVGVTGILAASVMCHPSWAAEPKVLAQIGNRKITDADLSELAKAVPEASRYLYLNPEGQRQTLDYIVNVYVLASEAERLGLEKSPSFKKIVEFTEKSILARLLLEEEAKKLKPPSEEDAKKYYEENRNRFVTPEMVHLRHILVKTEKEAKDVMKKLDKGEDFAKLAAQVSDCPSKAAGGDLGLRPRGRLVEEISNEAFKMGKGQIVGPVQTRFGYHVLYLVDKKPEGVIPFEEAKQDIIEQLRTTQQLEHFQQLAKALRKKMNVKIAVPEVGTPQAQPGAPAVPPAGPKK